MPIGATIGAAVVGAGATMASGAASASATRRASSDAARTSSENNAANATLARENRQFAQGVLQPYSSAGLTAQNALGGLLYGTPTQNALSTTADWGSYVRGNPDALANWEAIQGTTHDDSFNGDIGAFGRHHYQSDGARRDLSPYGGVTTTPQTAWDQFRNSSNYQFRYGEGMKGLNLNLANNGYQGSGAAVKEAIKYGQNFASNELGNYMQLLQGQQQIGMGAASAMVGVGQNTTNALMAGNNNNATNQANAGLMAANGQQQMYGAMAQGVGQIAGAVGSSYGTPRSSTTMMPSYSGSGGSWGSFGG